MGQPKFRPDAAKAAARYPAGVLGDPKPIAKRFVHAADLRHASLRRADLPIASPPADWPTSMRAAMVSAKGTRIRLLVVALALAALVPNLVLWLFGWA